MYYYEVAPTSIVRENAQVFTYGSEEQCARGTLVTVPIGKKVLPGVVMRQVAQPDFAVRQIASVIEKIPLPEALMKTIEWLHDYYQTHLALVLQTVLPAGMTKRRRAIAQSTPIHTRERTNNVFTPDQRTALTSIAQATPGTILLHGVTGCHVFTVTHHEDRPPAGTMKFHMGA